MARPLPTDSASFYHKYIGYVQGESVKETIANHSSVIEQFYSSLPEAKENYAYAEGKWTLKDLLLHVIDAERVFVYRTLRIARKDKTPLAGFDENEYAANSFAEERSFQSLKDEFVLLRKANDAMLSTLNEEQLSQSGTASNNAITANALAYITFGHLLHHMAVIKERYL
ncbi:MAG TPA: DinB family protein [Panacibacter sp.]|nr:DinB family protein [Panacibacter sp.]HNP43104.1 DinB family protein [Panacibacter sp.]